MLKDSFDRSVTYLRLSVTDRCDLRCHYCMSEHMTFLPKKNLLTLDELLSVSKTFVKLGVDKIRITGGEPLVRRNVMFLFQELGKIIEEGKLKELTLTTNATLLPKYAKELYECGVRRVNISLDTIDPVEFKTITRWGDINKTIDGIHAALNAGLTVKINAVALKNLPLESYINLINFCAERKIDITFIEVMPMGDVDQNLRFIQYIPLTEFKESLSQHFTLTPSSHHTGGPANYFKCNETKTRMGFIAPQSQNFCAACNRVRMTCTGTLYTCLGQTQNSDLRSIIRDPQKSEKDIINAIRYTVSKKLKGHDFLIEEKGREGKVINQTDRHMSVTGG